MSLLVPADRNGELRQDLELNRHRGLPAAEAFVQFVNRSSGIANDPVRAHILFEVIVYSILFVIGAFR